MNTIDRVIYELLKYDKSPTPSGVGLFVLRADSNNQMQGSGGALLAASSMAATP